MLSGWAEIVERLRSTRRSHGWREAGRIAWSGFWHRGGTRLFLVALPQPRPLPAAVEAARGHTFRFANVDDLTRIRRDPAVDVSERDMAQVASGAIRCMLQLDGEQLVGFAWVWGSQLAYLADGFHINLPDDTAYNYKSYTAPAYRGKGFQALRHLEILRALEPEGKRRLFGFVDHLNSRSLRGVRKSGYLPVGEFTVRRRKGKIRMVVETVENFWADGPRT